MFTLIIHTLNDDAVNTKRHCLSKIKCVPIVWSQFDEKNTICGSQFKISLNITFSLHTCLFLNTENSSKNRIRPESIFLIFDVYAKIMILNDRLQLKNLSWLSYVLQNRGTKDIKMTQSVILSKAPTKKLLCDSIHL